MKKSPRHLGGGARRLAQIRCGIREGYPQQQQEVGTLLCERESARKAGAPRGDASAPA
jgi:hypothetical protein